MGWTWKPYDPETNQYLIQGQDGGTLYNPAAQLPLPVLTGQGIGFVFNADEEQYHAVARALYPGGVDQETVSRGAGHVHQFNTYTVSPTQAASVYGAQLDLVAADGRAYRWSGKVDRVGQMPPGAGGALRARWSAAVYLPHTTAYQFTVDGAAAQLLIDGQPGPPAAGAVLPQGWRRVVVTANLSAARPLRLLVGESGGKPVEVAHNALWAVGPTAGLLRVSAGAAGAAPVQSVDPFIGFSSLSDPRWPGPGPERHAAGARPLERRVAGPG